MLNTDHPDAPKIEFPLDYPIKVIGNNGEGFAQNVAQIVKNFDPKFDVDSITPIPSKKGTFVSLRFTIWATGEQQLSDMHKALVALPSVKMVL